MATAASSSGGAATAPAPQPEPRTEREVVARFQEMRAALADAAGRLADLEADAREHELVIKTLKPMDASRRCYRLVGDVLVARTVGEALPAVERNKQGLDGVVAAVKAQIERQQKELEAFQAKYKIRVQAGGPGGGGGGGDGGSGGDGNGGGSKKAAQKPGGGGAQGVLVA